MSVMKGFEARHDLAVLVDLWIDNPDPGWEPAESAVRAVCEPLHLVATLEALLEAHGYDEILRALGGERLTVHTEFGLHGLPVAHDLRGPGVGDVLHHDSVWHFPERVDDE